MFKLVEATTEKNVLYYRVAFETESNESIIVINALHTEKEICEQVCYCMNLGLKHGFSPNEIMELYNLNKEFSLLSKI